MQVCIDKFRFTDKYGHVQSERKKQEMMLLKQGSYQTYPVVLLGQLNAMFLLQGQQQTHKISVSSQTIGQHVADIQRHTVTVYHGLKFWGAQHADR